MKKVISGILVLAFLLCLTSASAANPGTASNPLISKTYMDNTYLPNALSEAKKTSSDNLTTAFLEAKNKLASCSGAESILMRAGNISGYALTDGYERVVFSTGGGVSLRTGGSLIPLSGAVRLTVISGTVIDLSSGSTVSSGSHLTAGARYFCAENTVARYTADSDCVCLVDGYHTSYSNGYLASSQDGIAIIRQPSDATVKVGDNVSFSVDASGVGLEYRWQFKNPNSVWTFFNPANYPSSLTKSLTFTAKAEFNNYSYRCLITNAAGEQVYSDAGQITYSDSAALKINTQPVSLTTQAGGTALFSVSASGSGLTYVWQYRAPGGVWADVNSVKYPTALTSTMTFPAYAAYSGFIYRCVIKDAFGNSVISDTALFIATQTSFAIVSQPEDFSSTEGETASFRVSASGSGLSYQWQYSADGTKWYNVGAAFPSAKTEHLYFTCALRYNGYKYRCVITDSDSNKLTSSSAVLTVATAPPSVTSQPESASVNIGDTAVFAVTAAGKDLTYQWQYSNGAKWYNVGASFPSAVTNELTFAATSRYNGYSYRCVITDALGRSVTSDAAVLTVTAAAPPSVTSQPESVSASADEYVSFTVGAEGTELSYRWQFSKNGSVWGNVGANITGYASQELSFAAAMRYNGYSYRCVITDKYGKSVTSEVATLTVIPSAPAVTTQPEDVTADAGESVTFSVAAEGTSLSYQWQYSKNGTKWFNVGASIPSAVTNELTFAATSRYNGFTYRCVITDSYGRSVTSDAAGLTLN